MEPATTTDFLGGRGTQLTSQEVCFTCLGMAMACRSLAHPGCFQDSFEVLTVMVFEGSNQSEDRSGI